MHVEKRRRLTRQRYGQAHQVLDEHGLPTGDFHRGEDGRSRRGRDYWGDGSGGSHADEGEDRDRVAPGNKVDGAQNTMQPRPKRHSQPTPMPSSSRRTASRPGSTASEEKDTKDTGTVASGFYEWLGKSLKCGYSANSTVYIRYPIYLQHAKARRNAQLCASIHYG